MTKVTPSDVLRLSGLFDSCNVLNLHSFVGRIRRSRRIPVFYGLKYIVEDSVVPQSGMFGFLCMDTLTDRVPLRRNLHSGMPFGYTPINACFIWAIKNMAVKTVIDSHQK